MQGRKFTYSGSFTVELYVGPNMSEDEARVCADRGFEFIKAKVHDMAILSAEDLDIELMGDPDA